ncbi:hypothetical protein OIU78_019996 [Salix suchowensis]|nr:serine carboxypeptidase [Salix suchowensis]KAJ6316824.1 hypothetical protein OIU78_019996 [Salix suchowensis]
MLHLESPAGVGFSYSANESFYNSVTDEITELESICLRPFDYRLRRNVEDETIKYLNRKYVQEALHAQLAGVDPWTICSDVLKYEMESPEIATVPLLAKLVRPGIRDHKGSSFEALQAKELITGESAICLQVGDCCGRRQMDKMATAKFLAANFKMVAE